MTGVAHIAMTALLLQRGATPSELDSVLTKLDVLRIADHPYDVVQQVDAAINAVRGLS